MQIVNKTFDFNGNEIAVYGTPEKPYFIASKIAKLLGYHDCWKAVKAHVWDENKTHYHQIKQTDRNEYVDPSSIMINESGLYQMVFNSKMPIAHEFQRWVINDVLPEIRKTGTYRAPYVIKNQLKIENEYDLHSQVVSYIRKYYPDAVIHGTLGELINQTQFNRNKAYHMGYHVGISDLLLMEANKQHGGLFIEFKNPNGCGVVSNKQLHFKHRANVRDYKSIISDDYDEIIKEINDYMATRRLQCEHCNRTFKTENTLMHHYWFFHKIGY